MNLPTSAKNTPASQTTITVIDFETTGSVAGLPIEPWQIGMVEIAAGTLSGRTFESLLRIAPERPFNHHAPGRHALLRAQLAEAPAMAELWPTLTPWLLARPLAAHNVAVERAVLRRAAPLHRLGPWLDTLALARHCWPQWPSAKLEHLIERVGLLPELQAMLPQRAPHDALYDAAASALLLCHILRQPGWARATLQTLTTMR